MSARVVPVGLLTSYVRQLFDADTLLGDIWVEGEVSDAFVSRAGHVYFTLTGDGCFLKSVLFQGVARRQPFLPKPGDQVAAHGRVSIYERDGAYQLYVDVVQHAGVGIQALQLEQLRQRLEAEGLFEPSRKRPIPTAPRFVGVVTSAEGAVWHDIQTVMRRRYPLAHLLLSPAPVQGDGAPDGIVSAFDRLRRDGRADVVILARGGGSADDLGAFNDERVARAVFASSVPVVSAIGHETDWTIADLVADLRAPTPSAAAELCSPLIDDLLAEIDDARDVLHSTVAATLNREWNGLRSRRVALAGRSPLPLVATQRREVSSLRARASAKAGGDVGREALALGRLRERMTAASTDDLARRRHQVDRTAAILHALNPSDVLNRGYALVERAAGQEPVFSVHGLAAGERVVTRFRDGERAFVVADP